MAFDVTVIIARSKSGQFLRMPALDVEVTMSVLRREMAGTFDLVYIEVCRSVREALQRIDEFSKMSRKELLAFVKKSNPKLVDLMPPKVSSRGDWVEPMQWEFDDLLRKFRDWSRGNEDPGAGSVPARRPDSPRPLVGAGAQPLPTELDIAEWIGTPSEAIVRQLTCN